MLMNATMNINLKILNELPQILIRIRKQACTSNTNHGFVVRFEHVGQHVLHGGGVHGKEKTNLAVGKQGWRVGAMGGHEFRHGAWSCMGGPVVA